MGLELLLGAPRSKLHGKLTGPRPIIRLGLKAVHSTRKTGPLEPRKGDSRREEIGEARESPKGNSAQAMTQQG